MRALERRRPAPNARFALALVAGLAALSCSALCRADGEDEKRACVAAADLGQLVRDSGKYSEAIKQFSFCAAEQCPAIVRAQCDLWLGQVLESMPTVVFAMVDSGGHDLTDVRVLEDGTVRANGLDGRPIRLDPGAHELRFESPGRDPVVTTVVLRAGDKNRTVTAVAHTPLPLDLLETSPPPVRRTLWDSRTITSLGIVAAGALTVGGGVYFALSSQREANDAGTLRQKEGTTGCWQSSSPTCTALSSDIDAQKRDAAWGTGLYIAGGLLAAAGAITWVAWPKHVRKSDRTTGFALIPMLGAGRAGLQAEIELQ